MEYKVITELAYTYIGLVTTMTKHYVEDGVPLIFNSSIKVSGIDTSKPIFLDEEFAEKNKNRMHKKDDVVTVHTGDIGVSAVISDSLDGSLGFATIVTRINDQSILLPEINKQREIVELVEKLKNIIANRKQELKELDNLIKSRFVEMFGDCEDKVLIGDAISISRGASPRPISAFITNDEDGVNWIKIGDVSETSLYITKTEERITQEGAMKSRKVCKGDFILSNSMSFGRPYILGIDGCVHDGWLIMSEFKKSFNELYLYHAIRSDDVQHQFSGKVNGATVKNLNSDLVKNTWIRIPEMRLQEQFAAFVTQVDKLKFSNIKIQKEYWVLQKMQQPITISHQFDVLNIL